MTETDVPLAPPFLGAPDHPSDSPLFPLGCLLITPAVLVHLSQHHLSALDYIARHQCGDWGDVDPEDKRQNDLSVSRGARILSAYLIAGQRVWIITEANRMATTLLFPSEY